MNKQVFPLEIITRCFCGGAEPGRQAEIRAASIRGALRWWFRTLGGFKSMNGSIREQEAEIFGSCAGDSSTNQSRHPDIPSSSHSQIPPGTSSGRASKLQVRVAGVSLHSTEVKDADQLGAGMNSPDGYLLFPLRSNPRKNEYKGRGVFDQSLPKFNLHLKWRGDAELWPDIEALVTVFGHLGSLGFRSRRCMGAMAFPVGHGQAGGECLRQALDKFKGKGDLAIMKIDSQNLADAEAATSKLANWLKGWRSHGRTVDHPNSRPPNPPHNPGFKYAKQDHDLGVEVINRRGAVEDDSYRPAIGLPIVQFFTNHPKINWEFGRGSNKGRFASPVLLRPYRQSDGSWEALVLFANSMKWPESKPVFLNGQERQVSMALYEEMAADPNLENLL